MMWLSLLAFGVFVLCVGLGSAVIIYRKNLKDPQIVLMLLLLLVIMGVVAAFISFDIRDDVRFEERKNKAEVIRLILNQHKLPTPYLEWAVDLTTEEIGDILSLSYNNARLVLEQVKVALAVYNNPTPTEAPTMKQVIPEIVLLPK